jgi:hypothetical protein
VAVTMVQDVALVITGIHYLGQAAQLNRAATRRFNVHVSSLYSVIC